MTTENPTTENPTTETKQPEKWQTWSDGATTSGAFKHVLNLPEDSAYMNACDRSRLIDNAARTLDALQQLAATVTPTRAENDPAARATLLNAFTVLADVKGAAIRSLMTPEIRDILLPPTTPGAKVYTTENGDQWQEFLTAMKSGEVVEVDEENFYYWLDVLPPAYMNRTIQIKGITRRTSFGFAEGCERVTAFWSETDANDTRHFYCQKTEEMNPHA